MDYETNGVITQKILKEIDEFKGKLSDNNLTNYINEKFSTSFTLSQIKYQVDKLIIINYGVPSTDAYKFVEIAQKSSAESGSFFGMKLNQEKQLQSALYLSPIMLEYSNYFLDIVIVDTTYKRNRFNLPLVNIIGVNNYGHNILLAFGLLTDETAKSYEWLFEELKCAWKKDPIIFITDDSLEIQKGNLIDIYSLHKIFLSKFLLVVELLLTLL